MGNEDDTFNRLKRTPFLQVYTIYYSNSASRQYLGDFLKVHGWSTEDWFRTLREFIADQTVD